MDAAPTVEGKVVVYTDGACTNNQNCRFRRAGVGIFWCNEDDRNVSLPLPGYLQTNQRAELYAVKAVLEQCHGKLDIRTDSQYVFDGCVHHRHAWRELGFNVDNTDWQVVDRLLLLRPEGGETCVWDWWCRA